MCAHQYPRSFCVFVRGNYLRAQLLAERYARPLVRIDEKFTSLQMNRAMIPFGNYSPDPRATFYGNSRV